MTKLYPEAPLLNHGLLKVSEIHEIHWEESGNPDGQPVLFFHGGPGVGIRPVFRTFFNPKKYRIVMFSQRGCGKSKPAGELAENTAQDLVEDAEKLRKHLGIQKWLVFGGSWGSTMSLLYAEAHPEVVEGLILRGIFLSTTREWDWFDVWGANQLFPDVWDWHLKYLAKYGKTVEERSDFLYHQLIHGSEQEIKEASAVVGSWENNLLMVEQTFEFLKPEQITPANIAEHRVFMHYTVHKGFVPEGSILNNAHKIKHIPTVIIHGRYDVICPLQSAWDLHKALPDSVLEIVPASGHHALEKRVSAKLVEYTDMFLTDRKFK